MLRSGNKAAELPLGAPAFIGTQPAFQRKAFNSSAAGNRAITAHLLTMCRRSTMPKATERVPVLMTAAEKKRIARQAQKAGISLGEYLRRAALAFSPEDDNEALAGLLTQVERSTAAASAAIDDALAHIEASNRRIAAMEAAARSR
jgi:hypothetical protein